jgi:hypothetical protein
METFFHLSQFRNFIGKSQLSFQRRNIGANFRMHAGHCNHTRTKSNDFSSIFKANAFCLKENRGALPIRSETVQVRRVDSFIQELYSDLPKRRILLKSDTQGYDCEVFSGASGILDSVKLLQVEIPVVPLYEKAIPMPRALDIYLSAGFCVSGLFPASYSKDSVFVLEYDCLLVNQQMSNGLEQEQAPVPASLPKMRIEPPNAATKGS